MPNLTKLSLVVINKRLTNCTYFLTAPEAAIMAWHLSFREYPTRAVIGGKVPYWQQPLSALCLVTNELIDSIREDEGE